MAMALVLAVKRLGMPWPTPDPFLFCVHHHDNYPAGNKAMGFDPDSPHLKGRHIGSDFSGRDGFSMYHGEDIPGFPSHPHCGFETITILKNGFVDHSDSLGATARFGPGDVQWMTAGNGVCHSEMFPLLNQTGRNPLELFQIWVNLPKKDKKVPAHFVMMWKENIPVVTVPTDGCKDIHTTLTLIAGDYLSSNAKCQAPPPHSYASDPASEFVLWLIEIPSTGRFTLPAAKNAKSLRSLFFYDGDKLQVGPETYEKGVALSLRPTMDAVLSNDGTSPAMLLLMQGLPIGEPVVQRGPFVGNTAEDIQAAYAKYRKDQFGGWPWDGPAPVHKRTDGRFAKRPDGSYEIPPPQPSSSS